MATRLRLDPVACDGVGMCAHLAPDVVVLDAWGYPMLPAHPLAGARERQANRAIRGCPRAALFRDDPSQQVPVVATGVS